ncbi:hypothetical protein CP02DC18_0195 [Chlamydia psittaci 02DC18]|uniref:Uncharacterized protein n=1 Tax=Chlamydia psittaci 99DC5 TaxID=1112251 RepID=A0ABN0MQX3_CHLPS|nr:hypothetical protein CP02DC18_0195 [Chlamydia psittaci 02DC18]EPJ28777.1 hypothetical protein CP99DC5_0186 [Chlamydia psittaci 99DC5]
MAKQPREELALTKHILVSKVGVKHAEIHLIIISQTNITIKTTRPNMCVDLVLRKRAMRNALCILK